MKNYRREANWEAKWDKQDRKARIKWRPAGEEAAQAIVDLHRYVLELRRLVAIGSGNSFDIDGARLQLDVAEVHLHTLEKMVRKEVEDGKVTG